MKVLRIIFRQPTAHYRIGFTQQNLHRTLPLPPPSTIIGMVHNLMGCKETQTIKGFDIAICGSYESVFYQYQLFRNIYKPYKPAYKEVHPGLSMPNQVQLLYNIYLRIYIKFEEKFDKINPISREEFIQKLEHPFMPFIIGRREDLAIPENPGIEFIEIDKREFPQNIKLNHWINENHSSEYNLKGPNYLLGTYYTIQKGIRNFHRKRFIYIEPQQIEAKKEENTYTEHVGWIDEDYINNEKDKEKNLIPVFFLGINKERL